MSRLQVIPLGDKIYYDKNTFLFVREIGRTGECECCGTYDPKTKKVYPLTSDKIQLCEELKISYVILDEPMSY